VYTIFVDVRKYHHLLMKCLSQSQRFEMVEDALINYRLTGKRNFTTQF